MMNQPELHGSCLCGAVQVWTRVKGREVGACHCSICRKWGGGPLLAVEGAGDVRFEGADDIAVYESSEWAERGFCRKCGSHLFYRLKKGPHYALPAGLFDDVERWALKHQVFVDEKPSWYAFANDTENLTGAEVFAKFRAPGD